MCDRDVAVNGGCGSNSVYQVSEYLRKRLFLLNWDGMGDMGFTMSGFSSMVSKMNFFFWEGEGEQMGCKYDISFGFPTSQSVTPPGKSLSCACIYVGCMHRRSAMPMPMPTLEYAFC